MPIARVKPQDARVFAHRHGLLLRPRFPPLPQTIILIRVSIILVSVISIFFNLILLRIHLYFVTYCKLHKFSVVEQRRQPELRGCPLL